MNNRPPQSHVRPTSGFTLVEMLLVLAVLGLLAGAAVLKVTPMLRSASADDVARRLVELDNLARRRARSSGMPVQIVLQLDEGQAFYRDNGSSTRHAAVSTGGSKIRRVLLDRDSAAQDTGEVIIDCSAAGYTAQYAIQLRSDATSPGQRDDALGRWIAVSGLTGLTTIYQEKHEREIEQILWPQATRSSDPAIPEQTSGGDAR